MNAQSRYKAIVMGVSAGGFDALTATLPLFPSDFPLPILVVQHLHPNSCELHSNLLSNHGTLTVKSADDKESIQPGIVYMAPPNYHLLVELDHTLSLSVDPKVNFARPSIDVLFESAADAYGASLIGVILTGSNYDGSKGLKYIKDRGGMTIVQDPRDALIDQMPKAAIKTANPHHIVPLQGLVPLIIDLLQP